MIQRKDISIRQYILAVGVAMTAFSAWMLTQGKTFAFKAVDAGIATESVKDVVTGQFAVIFFFLMGIAVCMWAFLKEDVSLLIEDD
jgi:hypothetical protein